MIPNDLVLNAIDLCLQADFCESEALFHDALAYYEAEGEMERAMTIHLYLAYLNLQSGSLTLGHHHLDKSLEWLEAHQMTIIRHWWHLEIIGKVMKEAIRVGLFSYRAEILLQKSILYYAQMDKQGASGKKHVEKEIDSSVLEHFTLGLTGRGLTQPKEVLQELLDGGHLNRQKMVALIAKLRQREDGYHVSATMLATFGLYVQTKSKEEIAHALFCSKHTVSTYLTEIYRAFDLPYEAYPNPYARRRKLVEIAKQEGYI